MSKVSNPRRTSTNDLMESGGCSWLLLLKDRLPNLKASKIMKTSIKNNLKSMGPGFILWQPNSIFLKNKILRQTPWVMEKILDFCKKKPWFLWKKKYHSFWEIWKIVRVRHKFSRKFEFWKMCFELFQKSLSYGKFWPWLLEKIWIFFNLEKTLIY